MAIPVAGKLLLDTNVFVDYLRAGLHADWVFGQVGDAIRFLSSVVLMELRLGADTLRRKRAVVVNRGDEIPLGLREWGPEMIRSVVLFQFADIVRQNFPIVTLPESLFLIKPIFFARAMMVGRDTETLCLVSRISRT